MGKGKKSSAAKDPANFVVAQNKRARFEYELGDAYEAGMVLLGSEVKSLRLHTADLTDAWVDLQQGGEAWLRNLRIPQLKHASFAHEEKRSRKLLLHGHEIEQLRAAVDKEGMTVVATRLYFKSNRAKVEVALGKGKKLHDKRETLKRKQADREAQAAIRKASR